MSSHTRIVIGMHITEIKLYIIPKMRAGTMAACAV